MLTHTDIVAIRQVVREELLRLDREKAEARETARRHKAISRYKARIAYREKMSFLREHDPRGLAEDVGGQVAPEVYPPEPTPETY